MSGATGRAPLRPPSRVAPPPLLCAPLGGAHTRWVAPLTRCSARLTRAACSLGTCLFFSVLCALTAGVTDPRSWRGVVHRRGWALKLLVWAGLVALCFLPSNAVVETYFQAARAGAAVFLLLQLVIILDAVVTFNEEALERDDAASRAKLITGALAFNCGAIAGVACMYVYLWHTDRNLAFITVTAGIYALLSLLSLHPSTSGGIFTSGAVTAYCTYLCAVAIMSDPGSSAQQVTHTPRWLQVLGFAIALFALVHSTATAGGGDAAQRSFDVAPIGIMVGGGGVGDPEEGEGLPQEVHPLSYPYFHCIFALGAMYSAMLFTSWTNADTFSEWSLDKGVASMWVKVGCGACVVVCDVRRPCLVCLCALSARTVTHVPCVRRDAMQCDARLAQSGRRRCCTAGF